MLTVALMQLSGLIDHRPDLFYIRYEPMVYADEIVQPATTSPELLPGLYDICTCESGLGTGHPQQFHADGTLMRGYINPHDIGMCQINTDYHGKEAAAMSLDLKTTDGNILFANWLYTQKGSAPWSASRACWQSKVGITELRR